MGDCTLTLFKLFLAYFALSLLAGFVATALGHDAFAARWLFAPPVGLILTCGVSLFLTIVWWS